MSTAVVTETKVPNYINGDWKESKSTHWQDVVNPATGETIAKVPLSDAAEVNAAVEAAAGMPVPSADELKDLVRQALPVYNVPVAFAVVDELPRNPALKVSLPAVAALYDARAKR